MKLSIYASVRSIGWNITQDNQVIDYGVKRVNVDFDSYYAYLAGLPVPKRIDRRMKRSARRNLWRWKTRREKLLKILQSKGMTPTDELLKLDRKALNTLRHRACTEPLTPTEIGRVLIDLQSKRGYKSMRGVDDTGNSDYLAEIAMHEENRKAYPTVGAYLNSLPTNKDVILRRETYEQEFATICNTQQLAPKSFHGALYFQRPLRKGKVAFCRLEKNRKVTHASNPLWQLVRILRDVYNIEIFDIENNQVEISDEKRMEMFDLLYSGKDLTKAGALKILGLKKPSTYKWYSGKSIAGNIGGKILGTKEYDPIHNAFVNEVWQDLISATDDELLKEIIMRKYHFSEEKASEIVSFDIKGLGYCDYSAKALRKLSFQMLVKKCSFSEAILNEYGKVEFNGGMALRNVVLEQVFHSTRSLIEAIQAKYPIKETAIEIDRLLKMGNKARKELAKSKRRQEKDRTELDNQIRDYAELNDYNRQKMRLWNETEGYSPFEPERQIPLEELFTEKYNLDHIVPKSKLFDFSNDNLVLAPAKLNLDKNRMTGMDYAEKIGIKEKYVEFVQSKKLSERKKQLLTTSEKDIPTNYLSRSAGTDYNTRCFLSLVENAYCIPNKLVNMYLRQWQWTDYDEDDVRNALAKSFVIANFNQETIAYFDNIARASENTTSTSAYQLTPDVQMPDISKVNVYVPSVKYFRKTKHGYITRFSLHKETVYGERKRFRRNAKGQIVTELLYQVRQPIGKLTPNMIKNISDQGIKRIIEKAVSQYPSVPDAVQAFLENPPRFNGKPIRAVSVAVASNSLIPLHSAENGRTGKYDAHDRKVDFVYSSMMHNLRIVDGKRVVMPLITALKELNAGTFDDSHTLHKGDKVLYNGKQYFISGLEETGYVALRSVYTLKAENAMKITKVEEIAKLERVIERQV